MRFGVCYYPEHWPQEQWAGDARWLQEVGVSIVRMGEFAWSRVEPADGRLEFAWLDAAVELFAREGFEVVLGTPTAAPPRWLSAADPSTLPVDEEGRRRRAGGRHHVCPTSPAFAEHARRIVTAMAGRYAEHPAVIGWQIDNEFGESDSARCHCAQCGALIGMFWKRMTPWAGLAGLVAGTLGAMLTYFFYKWEILSFGSELSQSFWGAIVAFTADAVVTVAVTLFTRPKPVEELRGLVYGMAVSEDDARAGDEVWYRSPRVLGFTALGITATLSLAFF